MDEGLVFVAIWTAMGMGVGYFLLQGFRWPKASATIVGHKVSENDLNDGDLLIEFELSTGKLIRTPLWNDGRRFPFPFAWKVGERIEVAYNPSAPVEVTWPRSARLIVLYGAFVLAPFAGWLWQRL